MWTLDYYFGKKSDDPEDAGPSLQSHNLQPAIKIVIGKRKSWNTPKSSTSQKAGKIGGLYFSIRAFR